jgi:choline dehydrogenase-like flavoprotein
MSRSHQLAGADPGRVNNHAEPIGLARSGLCIVRAIGQAGALAPWRAEEVLPGPGVRDDDEEAVRRYLFQSLRTYSHQVGSCRMGTDDMAVVGTDLRVRGIDGLRVADASVMPSIVSANTNATVYGIAERAAALLGSG